jgi:serine/threonine protein kinase
MEKHSHYQKLINRLDASLKFEEKYIRGGNYFVCKVKKDKKLLILKSSYNGEKEQEILKKLKDLKNITHLVSSYGYIDRYHECFCLLKEYVEGETLEKYR